MNKSLAIIVSCFVVMNMRLVIAASGVLYRPQIPLAAWKKHIVLTTKTYYKQPATPVIFTRDQTKTNEGNGRERIPRGPLLKRIVPFLGNHKTDPNLAQMYNNPRSSSTHAPYHTQDRHRHTDHPGKDEKHKHDHSTSTIAPDPHNRPDQSYESTDREGHIHHHHRSSSTIAPDKRHHHTQHFPKINQSTCKDTVTSSDTKHWEAFKDATTSSIVRKFTQEIFIWHRKHILS